MQIDALSQNLSAFLTGYAGQDSRRLQFIIACNDWPYMANEAIRRRRADFLDALDMETLAAISAQRIDLQRLAADLLKTL